LPQGKFMADKAEHVLGFHPKDDVAAFWHHPDGTHCN
jgi:hypothetical protein